MQVAEAEGNRRTIMLALGAVEFTEEVACIRFGDLKRPWFRVVPDQTGRFSAVYHDDS